MTEAILESKAKILQNHMLILVTKPTLTGSYTTLQGQRNTLRTGQIRHTFIFLAKMCHISLCEWLEQLNDDVVIECRHRRTQMDRIHYIGGSRFFKK